QTQARSFVPQHGDANCGRFTFRSIAHGTPRAPLRFKPISDRLRHFLGSRAASQECARGEMKVPHGALHSIHRVFVHGESGTLATRIRKVIRLSHLSRSKL